MKISRRLLLLGLLAAPLVGAENLDLSTVPERQEVELTIYNAEDLTLVRERRMISFRKGINPLQFSWSNTLIDPTSVELRFGEQEGALRLLDTTFPHAKPQMLYWQVEADQALTAPVEISYFTSGIRWSADYVAIADVQEQQLDLESFVRIDNHSGEEYENAKVRLVVGEINLVEQIAALAQTPVGRVAELEAEHYRQLRQEVGRRAMVAPKPMMAEMALAAAPAVTQPKEVEKEGLGEYFIYTIEGSETIPDGWSKRLRSFSASEIPITTRYRYRQAEYGDQFGRLYLLTNDRESGLGTTPLPNGEIRILRRDATGGLVYLTQRTMQYVPIGDRLELNLGSDPEVLFDLVTQRVKRDEIWMQMSRPNLYQRVDDHSIQIDHQARVAGWEETTYFEQRIRNYSERPITVEIRRSFNGDVRFRSDFAATSHDYRTVEFTTQVAAGERKGIAYAVVISHGRNAKQQRVVTERK